MRQLSRLGGLVVDPQDGVIQNGFGSERRNHPSVGVGDWHLKLGWVRRWPLGNKLCVRRRPTGIHSG